MVVDDDGVEEADLAAENRALRARIEALQAQLESRSAHDRSREAFFLRVFEDAPIGLALVGLDERIAEANAALCDMLGYSREALLRLTVPDITHPDDADVEVEHKAGVKEGRGGAFQVEKRYVRADGGVLLGRLSVSTLFDDEGSPSYFVGQLEDVTRERAAEDGLRASEAMFRALVESTSELFVLISAEGSASFVSPAMTELLGWTPAERRGRPFDDALREEVREAQDRAEHVVEVVRDAADQLADRLHLLRLDQLGLGVLEPPDVLLELPHHSRPLVRRGQQLREERDRLPILRAELLREDHEDVRHAPADHQRRHRDVAAADDVGEEAGRPPHLLGEHSLDEAHHVVGEDRLAILHDPAEELDVAGPEPEALGRDARQLLGRPEQHGGDEVLPEDDLAALSVDVAEHRAEVPFEQGLPRHLDHRVGIVRRALEGERGPPERLVDVGAALRLVDELLEVPGRGAVVRLHPQQPLEPPDLTSQLANLALLQLDLGAERRTARVASLDAAGLLRTDLREGRRLA
ncbi:MAG TPA: hypothetical protein DEF51_03515, partial [Myxococcales bacterium]|nr:hypothetical protein [Myxococcales bacterium]